MTEDKVAHPGAAAIAHEVRLNLSFCNPEKAKTTFSFSAINANSRRHVAQRMLAQRSGPPLRAIEGIPAPA